MSDMPRPRTVRDRVVLVGCMLLGMSVLAPFNALISSIEYFHDAFRGTPLERVFSSGIITTFNATAVVCALLATLTGNTKRASPVTRIRFTLVACMVIDCVVLLTIALRGLDPPVHTYMYYMVLLAIAMAFALVQAYLQSATMVLCTHLDTDGHVMSYMLLGQAMNGVVGSIVNLLVSSMAAWRAGTADTDVDTSRKHAFQNAQAAIGVFGWTLLLQLITLAFFARMLRVPVVQSCVRSWMGDTHHDATMEGSDAMAWNHILRVQKRITLWSMSNFMLFAFTMLVYPGLTSRVRTVTENRWLENPGVFIALHIVAMNVGDLAGRRLPLLWPRLHIQRPSLALALSALRVLFIPAYLLCHMWASQPLTLPDSVFFLLTVVLGVTTGSCSTSFLISGPKSVQASAPDAREQTTLLASSEPDAADQDTAVASMLMSFWILAGLTAGSFLSILMNAII